MSTVLITGANRASTSLYMHLLLCNKADFATQGIGAGFVAKYLSRPNTTVIAAVRNPSASDSKSLESLPRGNGSTVLTVKNEGQFRLLQNVSLDSYRQTLVAGRSQPGSSLLGLPFASRDRSWNASVVRFVSNLRGCDI